MMNSVDYSDDERDADDFFCLDFFYVFQFFKNINFKMMKEKIRKIEKKEETGRE